MKEVRPARASALADERVSKGWMCGAHRAVDPTSTIDRVRPFLADMGVTRLADVTGLDTIGIPVVMAVRPNARGLSVSQGKGATRALARASAAMEAAELWHAEHIVAPLRLGTRRQLASVDRVIDVRRLSGGTDDLLPEDLQVLWVQGRDMVGGELVWVPEDLVHTDATRPPGLGHAGFTVTSNGLASGNCTIEAILHGLFELIERDARARFLVASEEDRTQSRLDLATITDPLALALIGRCERAGVSIAAWDLTTEVGVPVVTVELHQSLDVFRPLPPAAGHGCHATSELAFTRAITEAAQTRLTMVSGSRDDLGWEVYRRAWSDAAERHHLDRAATPGSRPFGELPSAPFDDFAEELAWVLGRLGAVDLDEVVWVDLSRPEFDIPVVRVLVPGLENVAVTRGGDGAPDRDRSRRERWAT